VVGLDVPPTKPTHRCCVAVGLPALALSDSAPAVHTTYLFIS
jgi:hypothetical protein